MRCQFHQLLCRSNTPSISTLIVGLIICSVNYLRILDQIPADIEEHNGTTASWLRREVTELASILQQLRRHLESHQNSTRERILLNQWDTIFLVLTDAVKTFTELEPLIGPLITTRSVGPQGLIIWRKRWKILAEKARRIEEYNMVCFTVLKMLQCDSGTAALELEEAMLPHTEGWWEISLRPQFGTPTSNDGAPRVSNEAQEYFPNNLACWWDGQLLKSIITVHVQPRTGNTKTLEIDLLYDTIRDLKSIIGFPTGDGCKTSNKISANHRLFHRGQDPLEDSKMVSDYAISEGAFLYVHKKTCVSVQLPSQKTIIMYVDLTETVADVKNAIEEEEGVPAETQQLSHLFILLGNCMVLQDCGIAHHSQLVVKQFQQPPLHPSQDGIQIMVRLISGKTVTIFTRKSSPVKDVMAEIEGKAGIRPNYQLLVFAGKRLEDHRSLSFYNVEQGSTITLTARLRSRGAANTIQIVSEACAKYPFQIFTNVDFNVPIKEIKPTIDEALQNNFDVRFESYHLFFQGAELDNGKSLSHYGFKTYSVLRLHDCELALDNH